MTARTPRIRIDDLSPLENLTEQEMAEISGAGRKGKWQFSGQSMEVLEVRQVMSAVTVALTPENQSAVNNAVQTATGVDPTVPEQLVPAVLQALQQVRQQAASLQSGSGQISFNSDAARQQFVAALDGILGSQIQNATSASLQAAGITVISRATASEINGFLTNGTAASQDLLVLRLQRSTKETLIVSATETDQLSLQGKTIAASVTGTLSGTLSVAGDLVFGLNASGRAFVREGSSVSASTDIKGTLSASANPNSQVGVALSGAGHFTGGSQYVLNDGDAIDGENLYLNMDALFSDFATNTTITGDMDFDGVTASLTVPGMSNPINVPATFEWNPIENTGNITIDENAVEDAILDGVAESVHQALEQLSDRTHVLTDRLRDIPVIGDEIESDVTNRLQSLLDVDVPDDGVRRYLEDRGFQINSTIGFQDLINGNLGDLFVVTWHRHEVGSTISRTATGNFGKGLIDFKFDGSFSIQPEYDITVTFGVDAVGGLFIQEGSAVKLTLTADATIDKGSASIPNLVNVHVTAHAPKGQHVVDASILAKVNDGDAQSGERLYATNLPASAFSVAFDAGIQVDATMSVDSPVQQLPSWIQSTLSGRLPDSITWTADVSYDVATDQFEYSINNTSLTDIVTAFQGADGVEGALKNYMLNRIAEDNPIPESTQLFLGTKIPLLEQNVMDLLDIPKAMQYVIAPLAFLQKPGSPTEGKGFEFGLQLFSNDNIERMLKGETYDIISLDIEQKFTKDLAKITVIPENIVATYFGIVNATLEVTLTPGFFLEIDMLTGIDSDGFFIKGASKDASKNDIKPHFKLGGELKADVIVEGDLLLVVDLLRVTGTVGIKAYGDMTFVSPHADSFKVRVGDINPEQIAVGLGVDLTLQMHGEVGLVDHDEWDKDVWLYTEDGQPKDREIELYKSNKVSLADIQDQIAEYKERLQSQGKKVIFAAAAATHDPHLVAAAISIVYKDSGMDEVVKKLVVDFKMRVDEAARALNRSWSELTAIADRLRTGAIKLRKNTIDGRHYEPWQLSVRQGTIKTRTTNVGGVSSESEVTDQLAARLSSDLDRVRNALRRIGEIASQLWHHCKGDLNEFAEALKALGAETEEIVTQVWIKCRDHLGGDLSKFAQALNKAQIGFDRIANEVWKQADKNLNRLAQALKDAGAETDVIVNQVWIKCRDELGRDLNKFAQALSAAKIDITRIANEVWSRATGTLESRSQQFMSALRSADNSFQEISGQLWSKLSGSYYEKMRVLVNTLISAKASVSDFAESVWARTEGTLSDRINLLAQALVAAKASASQMTFQLWDRCGQNLHILADAMDKADVPIGEIATELWKKVTEQGGTDAQKLLKYAKALDVAGGTTSEIAAKLWEKSSNDLYRFTKAISGVVTDLGELGGEVWNYAKDTSGSSRLRNTFLAVADSSGADRGYGDALRAILRAGRLTDHQLDIGRFLLNDLRTSAYNTVMLMTGYGFNVLQTFAGIAYSGGAGKGYAAGIQALQGANKLGKDITTVVRFLFNQAQIGLEHTARSLGTLGFGRLDTFWAIAGSGGVGQGITNGLRAITRAEQLSVNRFEIAKFLMSDAGRGLETTARTMLEYGYTRVQVFAGINSSAGAGRGYADGIRAIIWAGALANTWDATAGFLLNDAKLTLATTGTTFRNLGASDKTAFWSIVNGGGKSYADATRAVVFGGLVSNNYGAISNFLLARLGRNSAIRVLQDLF